MTASGRAEGTVKLAGQIFIRTDGGENIKLSLVEVALFNPKVIQDKLNTKRAAALPIVAYFQPLEKQAEEARDRAEAAKKLAEKAMDVISSPISSFEYPLFSPERARKIDENTKVVQAAIDAVGHEDKETSPVSQIASKAGIPIEDFSRVSKHLKEVEDQVAVSTGNDSITLAVKTLSEVASLVDKRASELCNEISNRANYPLSALYYFSNLPEPLQITKTDVDGKFTFKVPIGSYVLLATSSRKAGVDVVGGITLPKTEIYYWMVQINVNSDQTVMLANDNLASSGSPDSLIVTQKDDGNTAREDIQSLAAFVAGVRERERQAQLPIYSRSPRLAQQKAIELYPDLSIAGSDLNKEFVARVKRYQVEKKEFFTDPDWPIRLAKECSDELSAKSASK
jgi:hypothetical protein